MKRIMQDNKVAAGFTLVVALFIGVVLLFGGVLPDGNKTPKPIAEECVPTTENPCVGNDGNTDPVFDTVQNWRELVTVVENENAEWYKECMETRIGVTWDQAQQYAELVDQGNDLRLVLVSNASTSDESALAQLKDQGFTGLEDQPIVRVSSFRNTRGLPSDRCSSFGDGRSQVRVSLAIPNDVKDMTKGLNHNKGVLAMCSNPWDLVPVGEPPTTVVTNPPPATTVPPDTTVTTQPPSSTTTVPSTTTTTVCQSGKCVPPTTVAPPPTTVPPATTTTQPATGGQGTAGDGATNTTQSPTTTAPAPAPPTTAPPTTDPPPPAP